jgi:UDP-glucose 4-epimerase
MKNVLVTGGAGFIGSNLVDKLILEGFNVTVLDNLSTGKKEYINPRAKFVLTELCSHRDTYIEHFKEIDTVYHVAALPRVEPSIKDPVGSNEVNVTAALNVFDAARVAGVRRIVFSSSSSVYGDCKVVPTPENVELKPMSPYALQKQICEQYLQLFSELYGIETVCLRYFNVYGNRQPTEGSYVPVVGIFFRQVANNESMTITGDGKQVRDFVCVDDVVQANIKAMNAKLPSKFETYSIGSGSSYSLNEIADMCGNKKTYIEARLEPRFTKANIQKAKNELGYEPVVELEKWISENKGKVS